MPLSFPGQGEGTSLSRRLTLNSHWKITIVWKKLMNREKEEIERYRKALLTSIKRFAKDIQQNTSFHQRQRISEFSFRQLRPLFRSGS